MNVVSVYTRFPTLIKELRKQVPNVTFYQASSVQDEQFQKSEIIVADFDLMAAHLYDLPNLKWYQGTWAGVEPLLKYYDPNKPLPYIITRFSGRHVGRMMTEFMIACLVSQERNFKQIYQNQKLNLWTQEGNIFSYRSIGELTIGILGVGKIGTIMGQILKTLGADILAFGRRSVLEKSEETEHISEYFTASSLPKMLEKCDYIVNVLPSTPETTGLLNGEILKNCKEKSTVLVNIGRGSIIGDEDLVNALNNKWLSAAILDVFNKEPLPTDSPLWTMPQVTITPHVAAISRPQFVAEVFAEHLKLYNEKKPIPTLVDFNRKY